MTLSAHRQHKIYIVAAMVHGLGSEDPEEVAFYKQIKKEITEDRGTRNMGISRTD